MEVKKAFEREKDYILRNMGLTFEGAFLAGGAITSTFTNKPIADFDLYFKSEEDFKEGVRRAYDRGLWCVSNSGRAITFVQDSSVYQFMHFAFFATAETIFDSFDFTCCMAAIDLDSGDFEFHPSFLADTSKRELVFNHRTAYPLASAMRVLKYQEKGYTIRKAEMLKIVAACSFKPIAGWEELADQIGGRYGRRATLDTTKEFGLDEAIASLGTMPEDPVSAENAPGSAEEALDLIFGAEPQLTS